MPTYPISHQTWQTLRALARATAPQTGRELRINRSRFTKDGTWLDQLVADGLVEVASVDPPGGRTPSERNAPAQFRTRYRLTPMGEHAAEYGEFEREVRPNPAPRPRRAARRGRGR